MKWPVQDPAVAKRLLVGGLVLLVLLLFLIANKYLQPKLEDEKPVLALMSSLPLHWGEGDVRGTLSASSAPAPAYQRLANDFHIQLIDDVADLKKRKVGLLLMAQPRALSPSQMFALDNWILAGGRALILADPALQWESSYPLGDVRRPLFTSMLSPLFSHWGLELVMLMDESEPLAVRKIEGFSIRTVSPGAWQPKAGNDERACSISPEALLADCRLDKGRALLVADADLLDSRYWAATGIRNLSGNDDFANMDWIKRQLETLQNPEP
jgi:hypothetical protein